MYCSECGKEVKDSASFCPHCGAKLTPDTLSELDANSGDTTPSSKFPTGKKLWSIVIAAVAILLIVVLLIVFVPKRGHQKSYVTNPVYDDQGRRLFDPFELLDNEIYLLEPEVGEKTLAFARNPEFDGEFSLGEYIVKGYGKRSAAFFYSSGGEASSTSFQFGFDGDIESVSVGDTITLNLELENYRHEVINRMGYEFANYFKEFKVKKGKFISKESELPVEAIRVIAEEVSNEGKIPKKAYLVMVRGVSFLALYIENKTEQGTYYSVNLYDQPVAVTKQGKFIHQYGGGYESRGFKTDDETEVVDYLKNVMKTENDTVEVEDVSDKLP